MYLQSVSLKQTFASCARISHRAACSSTTAITVHLPSYLIRAARLCSSLRGGAKAKHLSDVVIAVHVHIKATQQEWLERLHLHVFAPRVDHDLLSAHRELLCLELGTLAEMQETQHGRNSILRMWKNGNRANKRMDVTGIMRNQEGGKINLPPGHCLQSGTRDAAPSSHPLPEDSQRGQ